MKNALDSKISRAFPGLEERQNLENLEKIPETTKKQPDALVLCKTEVVCRCGSKFESVNPRLLLRYDRTYVSVSEWFEHFNHIPREMIKRTDKSPACSRCFEKSLFIASDHQKLDGGVSGG